MKSSLFFAAALLAVVSIMLSEVTGARQAGIDTAIQEQRAGQFLHYVAALNDLYVAGTPAEGDASARVTLPEWLPANDTIGLRISAGTAYVFTPSIPGLITEIQQQTEYSMHFGLSDDSGIIMPAGRIFRPDFIPAGYVVYVR